MAQPFKSWDDIIKRVAAARESAPTLGRLPPPPPPPPPPLQVLSRIPPPPPPPPPTMMAAAENASEVLDAPRFASDHPYLSEWNRFMDAGVPNEYRTYGAQSLGSDPAVSNVARVLESLGGGQKLAGTNAYYGKIVPTQQAGVPYKLTPGTYGMASQRMNRAGDRETYLQVYGTDPGGRGAVLYSVPADVAERIGLAQKLEALGYKRGDDLHRP